MRALHPEVEGELHRLQRRWRWMRFWRLASIVVCALCAVAAALALVAHNGYLRSAPLALLLAFSLVASGCLALLIVAVFSAASSRPRAFLAAALERAYDPLLDRLNTLVHLEGRREDRAVRPYFRRIERQTVQSLPVEGLPSPFSWRGPRLLVLAALVALAATAKLYQRLEPWDRLSWGGEAAPSEAPPPDPGASPLEPPVASAAEVKPAWGEVRITEPGRDMKVTKVDVVPLQVEAASDQALKSASWSTATNGSEPKLRPLPPPAEPNYAVYKPVLYVDELRLQDWDVVSYFASASTAKGASYASEIYFLEVRPFREDIEKMPGGEGGKAYRGLNELTGLIERQRQILRETHRHLQSTGQTPELRRQDRGKLAGAERDLAEATRHAYAKLAAEMENQPIGDVLTHLASAESWIEKAGAALDGEAPDSMAKEQGALAELVATRKSFQKVISDNPGAFQDGGDGENEDTPVAELPDKLKQILELRDKEKAAEELVKKTLGAQRELQRKTEAGGSDPNDLAAEQDKLTGPLRDLRTSQPKAFRGAEKEADAAVSALEQAGKALTSKDGDTDESAAQNDAVAALEKLQGAMGQKRLAKELGHAYQLKDVLDREAAEMGRMQSEPSSSSREQAERSARDARDAATGLKKIVEEKPGKDAFGPGLQKALSDKPLRELQSRLDELARSEGDSERSAAAGRAKDAVDRVSKAFEESQPSAMRELQADRLKPGQDEALDSALAQLDGLTAERDPDRKPSPPDDAKRRSEILLNLRKGLEGKGDPATTARLLLRLEEALQKEMTPEEKQRLRKLRDEVERFRVEAKDHGEREADKALLTRVDPRHLPASYRDRIQRYFRKLSEQ